MTELAPLFVVGPVNLLTFFTAILCMFALIAHHHRPAFIISFATMTEPQLILAFIWEYFSFKQLQPFCVKEWWCFHLLRIPDTFALWRWRNRVVSRYHTATYSTSILASSMLANLHVAHHQVSIDEDCMTLRDVQTRIQAVSCNKRLCVWNYVLGRYLRVEPL